MKIKKDIFCKYLKDLSEIYLQSESTENSFYPVLKNFLKNYLDYEKKKAGIIIQPKRTDAGIPDFFIKTDKGKVIGYIEAKDPEKNLSNLSKIESEQIERYKNTFPNFIFTNFIDFILFRNGQKISEVRIAQPITLKLKNPIPQKIDEFKNLFDTFFDFSYPVTTTAKSLAKELAKKQISYLT